MSEQREQILKTAWTVIAEGGGWWKLSEVKEVLRARGAGEKFAHSHLHNMQVHGYLSKRTVPKERRLKREEGGARERVEYAVTKTCKVPGGFTAEEVVQMLTGQVMQGA